MTLQEYNKIKNLTYREYCDYLKIKYGSATQNYYNKNYNKNKISRTKEGLYCHHIFEDVAIKLSDVEFAKKNPFEYQLAENLCYCDLLEHLLLHIMICEKSLDKYTDSDKKYTENIIDLIIFGSNGCEVLGIGGITNFFVPELNDLYSGWITSQDWRANCHSKVINNKDVYLTLIKRFKTTCSNYPLYNDACLLTSLNEKFGTWSKSNNEKLFEEIKLL